MTGHISKWIFYVQNTLKPMFITTLLKKPNVEVKPTVQQMSGQRKCGIYTIGYYWALKRMRSCYSQHHDWNWQSLHSVKQARHTQINSICAELSQSCESNRIVDTRHRRGQEWEKTGRNTRNLWQPRKMLKGKGRTRQKDGETWSMGYVY